jgi:hypothetical protein
MTTLHMNIRSPPGSSQSILSRSVRWRAEPVIEGPLRGHIWGPSLLFLKFKETRKRKSKRVAEEKL